MLLANEEAVLQGMIVRLVEIERCCGMEMNVGIKKVMKVSLSELIMIDQKQLENMYYLTLTLLTCRIG